MEERMVVEDNATKEEEVEYSFTAYEIDLDYEFDAARFFDFNRFEAPLEARQAELWFNSAGSYPPSPFVQNLFSREKILMQNINFSPKSKGAGNANLIECDTNMQADEQVSAVGMDGTDDLQDKETLTQYNGSRDLKHASEKLTSGLAVYNHMVSRPDCKSQTKLSSKPSFPRTSTLLKPTASQLAKQNHPNSRSIFDKTNKSSSGMSGIENQAAKRQKLEGGLLRKVEGAPHLQKNPFVHKIRKQDGLFNGITPHTKPRITIPREPDLETAQRAHRTRPKSVKEAENLTFDVRRFKARPLNRKILEAPSLISKRSTPCLPNFQEFHLKTSERAMQHSSGVSNSRIPCDNFDSDKALHKYMGNMTAATGNRERPRTSIINASKPDGCEPSHRFKAHTLNKKILESKGDIGVFRNSKREPTVPVEFNFHTGSRSHHNPPIDLFNKLSLASDTQQIVDSESKSSHPIGISHKGGSKENRWDFSQQGYEIKQSTKLKLPLLEEKQQLSAKKGTNGVKIPNAINWSRTLTEVQNAKNCQ